MADQPGSHTKYFLFHAPGVSVGTAREDLRFCIEQARPVVSASGDTAVAAVGGIGGMVGGLVGGMIAARMNDIDAFRMRNAIMRKCMGLLGYDRYAVPQAEWTIIVNEGDLVLTNGKLVDPNVTERLANIAAGPKPAGEKLPR